MHWQITQAPECEGCKAMYSTRREKFGDSRPDLLMFPPCETCKVEILPRNHEALRIYMATRQQYIMGFNGPIDVNHMAVWEMIDRLKVKDPVRVFERITHCARVIISEQMKKGKDD